MDKYLIVFGDDNSCFYVEAPTFLDAVFEFAKYTSYSLKQTYEKALRAMTGVDEIIELYDRLTQGYDEIRSIYKIELV
ncbi:MAG: hypothetical protein NC299_16775 [Lachnospiraceae bacterium]|nr:hypothetical protein [Lachnospiraceae bacterium]